MPIKRKVSATEHEAIESADIKALYEKDGDGNFSIKLEEDQALVNALQRSKDEVKKKDDEVKALNEKLTLSEQYAEELKAAHGKTKGEQAAIEEAWKKKYADLEDKSKKDREQQTQAIKDAAVREHAAKLSAEICIAPDLMTAVIEKRLSADIHEGKPIIRVLDRDGKPSALSLTELGEEFKKDDKFSKVIIATKASGASSGTTSKTTKTSQTTQQTEGTGQDSSKKYTKMTAKDLAAVIAAKRESKE